ncbi:MAG: carbohydrate binding domain-containing protein [Sedimentisphaerales bacterium]|nr:carbohydrate binding domain-containing protein [Sedimentisphaerales bacterium]
MRVRAVWLTVIWLTGFMGASSSYAQGDPVNLLVNGGFEDGVVNPWGVYGSATGEVVEEDPIEGKNCLHVTVSAAGANIWDSGLTQRLPSFEKGKKYTFSAFVKCDQDTWRISFKPELPVDPYTAYGEQTFTVTDEWTEYSTTTPVFADNVDPAGIAIHIAARAGEFWLDGARFYEGDYVAPSFKPIVTAENPSPADGADDVAQDVVLSWEPSVLAVAHDVYLGTVFDDVNNADTTDALGVLVSPGQAAAAYAPDDLLDFGQTYYWRVDEVNAPPDSTVFPGVVWSFTVEPYSYPVTNITATASSEAINMQASKTVDGSGLNADDEHSTNPTAMWLSDIGAGDTAWIQYEFDQVYALDKLWVWNSNQAIEYFQGFGAKDVTIQYSLDGIEWLTLGDFEFERGTSQDDYTHNPPIDFGGVEAQYVRLTITGSHGGLPIFGLSEVRFFYVPTQARAPEPSMGADGVALDAVLNWRPGRGAASHEVYISTDRAVVEDGTALAGTTEAHSFDLSNAGVAYGQNVYWKVNELDESGALIAEGEVWRFSTAASFAVDDFESYTNDSPDRIFQTWLDGLGYSEPVDTPGNDTGAIVGHDIWSDTSPYFGGDIAETDNAHDSGQAMPLYYDNSATPFYSETERTWAMPQDWSANGVTDLSLWFRGNPVAFEQTGPDSITMSAHGVDIEGEADEFRFAYKQLSGNGSIIARVDSIGNTDGWAKAGVMIRESLDPGSKHVMMVMTPDNGVSFQRRLFSNGSTTSDTQAGIQTPHWVKLSRTGNTFAVEHSADGVTWESIDGAESLELSMINNTYIGLALTSHNPGAATVAEFSGIQTGGGVSGAWQVAEIGTDHPANDRDDMYVVVEDSVGRSKVVVHPDANAVLTTDWTEWKIPLSDFSDAGVNLAAVKKMYIGVGSRTAPSQSGSGVLYIDDIRVGTEPVQRQVVNLLINGGFEDGVLDPWYLADNAGVGATAEVVQELVGAVVPEDPVEGNSCLHVVIPGTGANFWNIHFSQPGFVFEAGKRYTLSGFFKCKEGTLDVNFKPELAVDPWSGYGEQVITIGEEWAEYSVTTPVFDQDTPATITFHVGFAAAEFWADDVRFYEGGYVSSDGTAPEAQNLLANSGFESGTVGPWNLVDNTGGGATADVVQTLTGAAVPDGPIEGDSCLHVVVPTAGANFWDVYLTQGGYVFEAGKKYTLAAFVKCSAGTLDINFKPELAADPWSGYGEQVITMTEEWVEHSVTTPVFAEDTSPGSITFHVGFAAGDFWIDNVQFYEGDYIATE